jgi:hypothetical protein
MIEGPNEVGIGVDLVNKEAQLPTKISHPSISVFKGPGIVTLALNVDR